MYIFVYTLGMGTPLSITEARSRLTTLVQEIARNPRREPFVIGSHRKPQAMLVPYGINTGTPVPTLDLLRTKKDVIHTIARAHHISTVSVTGSVARGEATETSDVDLICETEPNADLYDVAGFELDMEQLLGFPVQVLSASSLHSPLDDSITRDTIALW